MGERMMVSIEEKRKKKDEEWTPNKRGTIAFRERSFRRKKYFLQVSNTNYYHYYCYRLFLQMLVLESQ
jgi:hypothetical protein